jgi:uncharacterized protein YodC (DUF2158 family)
VIAAQVPPAQVAKQVVASLNRKLKLAGNGAKVSDVVCVSRGGARYSCTGRVSQGSQRVRVRWAVTSRPNGSYQIFSPTVLG